MLYIVSLIFQDGKDPAASAWRYAILENLAGSLQPVIGRPEKAINVACRQEEMVAWLRSERAPVALDAHMCATAAAAGNLDILVWLRSLNCPWNARTSTWAFIQGHQEMLSWLAQQGCPDPSTDDFYGVYNTADPSDSSAWIRAGGPLRAGPAHKLLGQPISPASAEAFRSCYRPKRSKDTYLPQHLQQIFEHRGAAAAADLDTTYVDDLLSMMLAKSQAWCFATELPYKIAETVVCSGYVQNVAWLLQHAVGLSEPPPADWYRMICSQAARSGQTGMLELMKVLGHLGIADIPSGWQEQGFQCILSSQKEASIRWLHQHFPACFTVDLCRAAVSHLHLLKALRHLQPPCPWDSSVSRHALGLRLPRILTWLLNQDPPCPMELAHARRYPLAVAGSGHVATMQQIWPVDGEPQMMIDEAARHGHVDMLRFLLDKHPRELNHSTIFSAAQNDEPATLLVLLDSGSMSRTVLMVPHLPAASGRCLVALAKAGHRMDPRNKRRISTLLSPWATLVGLVRWASRLQQSDHQFGGLATSADQSSHELLTPAGGNMLLVQLAKLPTDIGARIISHAVPTPAIADPAGSS